MKRTRTKRIVLDAILTAMALAIWVIEAQIPLPLPVPGIKLGLSNVVTLFALFALGPLDAGIILLVRIGLGSLFGGGITGLLFSLAGGGLSYLFCLALRPVVKDKQMWVLGALSAVLHNVGQVAVAYLITKTKEIWLYLPLLAAAGVVTGLLTGSIATVCYLALKKHPLLQGLRGGEPVPVEPKNAEQEDTPKDEN